MGHARALISLGDPKLQVKIFEEIQEHGYSVRKVEEIVKSLAFTCDNLVFIVRYLT